MLKKKIRDEVANLLDRLPKTRDSDDYLVAMYWYEECQAKSINLTFSALKLLEGISKGRLTSFESITRCRRKIQEENVNLRGSNYSKRKHKLTNDVMQQLNDKDWKYGRK